MSGRLTRRSLLRRGGAVTGAGLLGASGVGLGSPAPARAQTERGTPNALLIVVSGLRADSIGAYEGAFDDDTRHEIESVTLDTPNFDRLAGDAIRFERALPDTVAAMHARRALVSGRRAFPYRDWSRTEGLAPMPGFSGFLPRYPTLPEWLGQRTPVKPIWVTDNPLFESGKLYGEVVRTRTRPASAFRAPRETDDPLDSTRARADIEASMIPTIEGRTAAFERATQKGVEQLERLKRSSSPFFLAVDGFDQAEAYGLPHAHVRGRFDANSLLRDRWSKWLVDADFDDDAAAAVRAAYDDSMRSADESLGRLLDKVADAGLDENTIVYLVGDGTTMLGEYGALGPGAPGAFQPGYFVPYMIRDPDRRRAGDAVEYHASTHDVAPTICTMMGFDQPGRWQGNDLSAEFDDDDILLDRPMFVSANMTTICVMRGKYTMLSEWNGGERALYDDRNEHDTEDDLDYPPDLTVVVKHPREVREMWEIVLGTAGGNMPAFDDDGTTRPEREDDDADDDGIKDSDETNEDDTAPERDLDQVDREFDENTGPTNGQSVPPDQGPTGDNVQPLPSEPPSN